ncbi:MAG TPA: ABC transporter permease, partial [Opitutaceae bacterium]|nr:ABC transporter permease [Opitutaceae bacterium]
MTTAPQSSSPASTVARPHSSRWFDAVGILPVLIAVVILFAFIAPNFLTSGNLINVVRQASINLVLAAGMTFVILTRGIDLAVGSVLGVAAVLAVQISLVPEWSWAAVPTTLLVGAGIGALTGILVAYLGLPPFIVTLGT